MKDYEFYKTYANVPLGNRFRAIGSNELSVLTLHELYERIQKIDDKIRPDIIEKQKLLQIAEKSFDDLAKNKEKGGDK